MSRALRTLSAQRSAPDRSRPPTLLRQFEAMIALFRCDASPAIGAGHLMRCLSLATVLARAGWQVAFATRCDLPHLQPFLAGFATVDPGDPADAADLGAAMAGRKADLLVVDSYSLGERYEKACRSFAARILAIDDLADRRHDCDLLLDQTPGRSLTAYTGLVPQGCDFMLGADYALLRPDFAVMRDASLANRKGRPAKRFLVSFGAADMHGLAASVTAALLETFENAAVDIVVGPADRAECEALLSAHPARVALHFATQKMESLMASADIGIGAAGTTSWERCAMGLPSIVAVTAENQRLSAASLVEAGAAVLAGDWQTVRPARAVAIAVELARDPARLAAMAAAAARLCDCRGSDRLLAVLAGQGSDKTGRRVRLRLAEHRDAKILYDWQTVPGIRRYARNAAAPAPAEHAAWMASALRPAATTGVFAMIVVCDDVEAGLLQLRPIDVRSVDRALEVSLLVAPDYQGAGVARAALELAKKVVPNAPLVAEIAPENKQSLAAFQSAGFKASATDNLYLCPARVQDA
jgi:UDP-2,4-diacetamido-2,4,6-trideoxy-beta-L-altropyranose hydrolase